jgi:hypothetical protein
MSVEAAESQGAAVVRVEADSGLHDTVHIIICNKKNIFIKAW